MTAANQISEFLRALRRRLVVRAALRATGLGLAAVLIAFVLLAIAAASFGPAGFWRPLTFGTAGLAALIVAALGVWRPWRAVHSDARAAHVVGRLDPGLAALSDDLLSAVELGTPKVAPGGEPGGISTALMGAFRERLSETIGVVNPTHLVSMRPALLGALAALLAATGVWIAARVSPQVVGKGLSTLTHRPSRFEGAAVSLVPIVGDVRITYQYPAYTGLPPRTIEGSTGDVMAVKGTRVTIETTPLHRSRGAALLLGENGDAGEVPVVLHKNVMTARLTLSESASYRFWLQPLLGRAVREQQSHRLEAEPDRPPRAEIHGPADRLELAAPRPIEVGFAAADDYGLASVELVYRVDEGPEHRQPLKDPLGARVAEGRIVWDPSSLPLSPGARIAYHVEARDRDEVSGAKVGSSRTLYVVISHPQETVTARLDRQREILEHLIADLADRLEIGEGQPPARGERPGNDPARRATFLALDENEEAHLTLLGRLLDDDRREATLGKALRVALAGIADRLGKLLREEKDLLRQRGAATRLRTHQGRHVAELERSVLLMDDLGKDLRDLRQMLDENAEGFGAERFPQENRVVSELMKKIGDLEGDERAVAGDTKSLADKQDAETQKRLRDKLADWTRQENEKIEKLKQKLAEVKTGSPESALSEEVERARDNARQLRRLLGERDLAEAKQEAERAVTNLDRLNEHLADDEHAGNPGNPGKESTPRAQARAAAARSVGEARAMAQEISDDLRNLMPRPEETLSAEDRARAQAEGERQNSIGDRTEDTAREAARQLAKMPGLEHAADDLKAAAQQMREASSQLRRGDAKQAGGAQQNAVERLAKLRDSLQERSSGGVSPQHDPVRIPGADESQAPRAWRQELMDAMKEKAPEHFRDDVRRYYEELVK